MHRCACKTPSTRTARPCRGRQRVPGGTGTRLLRRLQFPAQRLQAAGEAGHGRQQLDGRVYKTMKLDAGVVEPRRRRGRAARRRLLPPLAQRLGPRLLLPRLRRALRRSRRGRLAPERPARLVLRPGALRLRGRRRRPQARGVLRRLRGRRAPARRRGRQQDAQGGLHDRVAGRLRGPGARLFTQRDRARGAPPTERAPGGPAAAQPLRLPGHHVHGITAHGEWCGARRPGPGAGSMRAGRRDRRVRAGSSQRDTTHAPGTGGCAPPGSWRAAGPAAPWAARRRPARRARPCPAAQPAAARARAGRGRAHASPPSGRRPAPAAGGRASWRPRRTAAVPAEQTCAGPVTDAPVNDAMHALKVGSLACASLPMRSRSK